MSKIFTELKRRNVFRVAMAYVVISWVILQVANTLVPVLDLSPSVSKFIFLIMLLGFIPAIFFAWAFEITPEGIKKEKDVSHDESITNLTAKKLDMVTIGLLVVAIGLFGFDRFSPREVQNAESIQVTQTDSIEETDNTADASTDSIPEPSQQSIAVLPFEDFSSDKDQEYFANGISEELLNVLARIEGLRVSSRTSAFAFKGQETPISKIGEALNVAHVLEGSIRKSGSTLRITAQLIDTKTDVHMWSDTYDRPLTADNIFAIQDEIAAAIVAELRGQLKFDSSKNASSRTASVEAFQLYLRARENMSKRKPDTLAAAVDGFKSVIALDPTFAPAYAGLADTYLLMAEYADLDNKESIELAKPMVAKALELAPNSAEALTAAASLSMNENDNQAVIALANKAIAVNPNYVLAYHRKGLAQIANPIESLATFQKALELDPLSSVLLSNKSHRQMILGDINGARKTSEDNIRWNPDSPFGYGMLAELNAQVGDYAIAHSYYKDAQALNPSSSGVINALIGIYMNLGLTEQARLIGLRPNNQALLHLLNNDPDKARLLLSEMTGFELAFAHYLLQDYGPFVDFVSNFIPANQTIDSTNRLEPVAALAVATQSLGRTEASEYIKLLDEYYSGKSPADFTQSGQLYAGAIYEILKNKPKLAYAWLERSLELGFIDRTIEIDPAFNAIRDTAEFKALLMRNAENAATHREAIEEQLANPKPNWVMGK